MTCSCCQRLVCPHTSGGVARVRGLSRAAPGLVPAPARTQNGPAPGQITRVGSAGGLVRNRLRAPAGKRPGLDGHRLHPGSPPGQLPLPIRTSGMATASLRFVATGTCARYRRPWPPLRSPVVCPAGWWPARVGPRNCSLSTRPCRPAPWATMVAPQRRRHALHCAGARWWQTRLRVSWQGMSVGKRRNRRRTGSLAQA